MTRKSVRKFFCSCFLGLVMTLSLCFPFHSFAETSTGQKALLPVSQVFTTNVSGVSAVFRYQLVAKTAGEPVPEGGENGTYVWSMDGTCSDKLEITFDQAGVFEYTVSSADTVHLENYTYETRTFDIMFYIGMNADGTFEEPVTVIRNPDGTKPDVLDLDPTYHKENSPGSGGGGGGNGGTVIPNGTKGVTLEPPTSAQVPAAKTESTEAVTAPDGMILNPDGSPTGIYMLGGRKGSRIPKTGELLKSTWSVLLYLLLFLLFILIVRRRRKEEKDTDGE